MEGTQEEVVAASEPFFSLLDFILLGVLLGGAAWWLLKNKKKVAPASVKSYSIQPTAVNTMTMAENSFIKKLKSSGRSLVVFYGSQTGTAEEFAGRLAKEGIRYRMKGMVADPEECDMEELLQLKDIENSLAVFCLATYGEGDPTDNAMEFYEWITSGDVDLTGLNYSVSINRFTFHWMATWNLKINSLKLIYVIESHSKFE
jgi:NADPH-ferrihemoprotein reductase